MTRNNWKNGEFCEDRLVRNLGIHGHNLRCLEYSVRHFFWVLLVADLYSKIWAEDEEKGLEVHNLKSFSISLSLGTWKSMREKKRKEELKCEGGVGF